MADWRIRLRRGNSTDTGTMNLLVGELAITLDKGVLWYADGNGNEKEVKIRAESIRDLGDPDGVASLDDRAKILRNQLPLHISSDTPDPSEGRSGDLWLRYDPALS